MKYLKYYLFILITACLYFGIYKSGYIEYVDYKIYDFYSKKLDFKDREQNLTHSVVVVNIDQKSVDSLGQWPWPRIIDAELIKKINEGHPASIGLDILFNQPDKSSIVSIKNFYKNYMDLDIKVDGLKKELHNNDEIFANTLSYANATLAVYLRSDLEAKQICYTNEINSKSLKDAITTYKAKSMVCNIDAIHKAAKSYGFVNVQIDKDAIMRRLPLFIEYQNTIIPSFALANLLSIDKNIEFLSPKTISMLGHTFRTDSHSHVLLHFYKPSWYKHISAIDILQGNIPPNTFTGKTVLIGTSLIGQNDRHIVTTRNMMHGVDIHATLIENILNDHLIWQPSILKIINIIFGFIISVGAIILLKKRAYYQLSILFTLIFILSFLISLINFQYNIYNSIAYLWVPLTLHLILLGFVLLYVYDNEKKQFYKELTLSHSAALESMVLVVETKDFETGAHLVRTKEYIKLLAITLKENRIYKDILTDEFIDIIYRAAPLHDIGKVGIPDSILQKPGKLNDQEYKIIQNHPTLGMKIISNAIRSYNKNKFLIAAYNIAYYHHEKWDGSGYPTKLKGDAIPLEARLMAIVDVYDALISNRCYKNAYSFERAESIIIKGRGKHFDPKLVDAFIELKDQFKEIAINNK